MIPEPPWPLPAHIKEALASISAGSTADAVESAVLEFKEDRSQSSHTAKGNPKAELTEKLIDEAICFANADGGTGYIIIGVSDKTPGRPAFTGTQFDTDYIEDKVFKGTRPNLHVEATECIYNEVRLVIVRVPEGRTLYTRTQGQAKRRIGTHCKALTEEERQAIISTRANTDFSNRTSTRKIEDIELSSLSEARRLLRSKRERSGEGNHVPDTTPGLLRELGLVTFDGQLKRAGEILLLPLEIPEVSIRHLWRAMPGSEPKVTEFSEPIIAALPRLRRLIAERSDQEIDRVQFSDGQEVPIPRFPAQAIDEAVTNAIIHRDWQITRPIVIDQSPRTLKITSPGALPPGVSPHRLLTTQSIPRNNRLMASMRALGLAEESSRGFDRMWSAMINSGRNVPTVIAEDTYVEIIMAAGQPDTNFIRGLHNLSQTKGADVTGNVNTLIVLWHLWHSPLITFNQVKEQTQTSPIEVDELMNVLQDYGIVAPVRDAKEWVLTDEVRKTMGMANAGELYIISVQEWIEEKLHAGEQLHASELAKETGLGRKEVTDILRHLRTLGRAQIDPSGPSRGPNTRWITT
ncbi:Putative transcriptional regulator with HTH domain [Corynebacterium camporealensis]|uniref:Putative transcriptional regulator with HTH domain n=1 Tax=Corynebacterium camporealensis TaxID=161896 RepID=A0A0F6TC80_9CORY|nr:RNA-binding domain-containing protein [Corynebacterium camporealensis]AKE40089.1 putative transcriptional regulator with HTH domain [Corynebacterium camporealensis]AVH89166.1 Putative transcriptional regulator with HTH domain [Corynebacterium camporealensis]